MKHIPVDTKRYEDAKAASLRRNITDKVSSSQSDDGSYYTAETSQHGQGELGSASMSESTSSASGAISSSSPTQDRDELGVASIATREETHGTDSYNRPFIDFQGLIRSAQARNTRRTRGRNKIGVRDKRR